MSKTPYINLRLNNGITLIAEQIDTVQSVSLGFFFKSGVLYEHPQMLGVSHFIEHMLFKGTVSRNAKQIASEFDRIGGYINAFTAKDYACYYARVVKDKLPIAIEVLSDMVLNSHFLSEELERERKIILEEIKMYEDSPDEIIHEVLGSNIWGDIGLGNPILGTSETVSNLTREKIYSEFSRQYVAQNLSICIAGNFDKDELQKLVERHLANFRPGSFKDPIKKSEPKYAASVIRKDIEQVHIALGTCGIPFADKRRYPATILNAAFGGGMSSRLFQEIREQRGLAYNVYSYHTSFKDSGLFGIYAGTSIENLGKVLELFYAELNKLLKNGLTEQEVIDTQEQLKGNMSIALESTMNRMNRLSTGFLYGKKPITPEQALKPYLKVTVEDVANVAKEILNEKNMAITMIAPSLSVTEILKNSPFSDRPILISN